MKTPTDTLLCCRFLREHLPPTETPPDLQHLRRLVKTEHLPLHLRLLSSLAINGPTAPHLRANARASARPNSWPVARPVNRPPNGPSSRPGSRPTSKNGHTPKTLRLVVCAASLLTPSALRAILLSHPSFQTPQFTPDIRTVPVPRHAPTSAAQAEEWTARYWPTVYKASNPFGPHPAIFAKAGAKIAAEAGEWLALADHVGKESQQRGWGEGVGVVVVENEAELSDAEAAAEEIVGRSKPKYNSTTKGRVVAVAGDARWLPPFVRPSPAVDGDLSSASSSAAAATNCKGNPASHAIMRAIALVASARRALLFPQTSIYNTPPHLRVSPSGNSPTDPLTPLETHFHKLTCTGRSGLKPGGYLCLNLTLYVTHEPCVMCSMALLHSRFGRVIIGERMPGTGAICAEVKEAAPANKDSDSEGPEGGPLGYGLWWRRDLNWRTLGWEWGDDKENHSIRQPNGKQAIETRCKVEPNVHG